MISKPFQPVEILYESESTVIGFTTRNGGVNPDWGLNLGVNTLQNPEEIKKNREEYFQIIGKSLKHTFARQVHSNKVLCAEKEGIYDGIDGFCTREKGLVLNILTADCMGILLYDEKNRVISALHAGWKGTAGKICREGIQKMISLGAEIKNIKAWLGPSIRVKNYEVGNELLNHFPETSFVKANNKLFFDLLKENETQLEKMGIQFIASSPLDTFEEKALYSYRMQKDQAGRFSQFIYLKP
ncbi:MAG TPA: peptidoglycan editing factor PgeF [Spirochaetia bacterium]|nr:MAG: hypothetical protein A2Y41_09625 [Spirochaetes bacterium GWB1_36_13]HCL57486.1 peptidoglycan editing factor PgeF [Spirochaetia bacterium]